MELRLGNERDRNRNRKSIANPTHSSLLGTLSGACSQAAIAHHVQWLHFWLQQISTSCPLRHLDFILRASRHLGWPASQHACYWLTPSLNRAPIGQQLHPPCLEPSLHWMTQKISGSLSSGCSKGVEMWTTVGKWSWLPLAGLRPGPAILPGCVWCWRSVWPARCFSSRVCPPMGTLCGPLVVTVLQAAWCGHVCHIPPPSPSCQPNRRRAASWRLSCHTWMMLLRLGVWQWLASVTITIGTSFLIHLVQKVLAGDWQAFSFFSFFFFPPFPNVVTLHHLFYYSNLCFSSVTAC